ncbi:MAG: thioester reductase domain-containing protein [Verrucomicrobia bacterium]|nr:thioester reductase domain-containing protein [Verrucomicrobiota bacterium]
MKSSRRPTSHSPFATWRDLLHLRATQSGGRVMLGFFPDGQALGGELTYAGLARRARAIAAALHERGCAPGDRALLLFPSGLEFFTAFFGCLEAGVIAVPIHPPRANDPPARLAALCADCAPTVALTTRALLGGIATALHAAGAAAKPFAVDEVPDAFADALVPPAISADTLAFLQYTSGSTGRPKGVMLTHGNLLANEEMIQRVFCHEPDDIIAGWLPLFHDMGLIGISLQPIYVGMTGLLMPPTAFLQQPLRWLQMLSREHATVTGAPNFAYDLCVRRTTPEERASLDLSHLRIAFNGSEPIHAPTLEAFAATFAPCGFRPETFLPCYGMAEASLLVSGKTRGRPTAVACCDPEKLAAGAARLSTAPTARTLVSSGRAAPGLRVVVVDPATQRVLPDGTIGEIWVHGPSIGQGYWNQPDLSEKIFGARRAGNSRARFLRTGDLGFLREGELFVTGRAKDLIIVRGRNHYPQDLEATALGAHPALRAHGAAAFAVDDGATEGVALLLEVERTALRALDAPALLRTVREALLRTHEIVPTALALLKPATLAKTSSGKIQRAECRRRFLAGECEIVGGWRREPDDPRATEPAPAAPAPDAAALQQWLVARVAAALKISATSVDPHAPLATLGLDSLAAVELSGDLEKHLGRAVAPTIVYDHPTIARLAAHFAAAPSLSTSAAAPPPTAELIAVVGLGCRFPGGADSPEAFWQLLRAGTDPVREIPAERWDVDAFVDPTPARPGKMYVRRGAFLDDVAGFDPEFFGIAPREATAIDPQHRLLLEVAWEALEHAAISPAELAGTATGVFVGVSFDDYARLAAHTGAAAEFDAYAALGSARSLAAARLSYHLGLRGPSLLVDTLCSSSLLAVHLAVQSLRRGECRVALAGGANLILAPDTTIASCQLRALAPDGRCKTFDASADGYARGEGAGLVVLKRLADAQADGDPILAVLRGSATNHDGKSNGLTAPNGPAQEALLRAALADARATPAEVGAVETHGTGTVLGDPIEVGALAHVYGDGREKENAILLGAVKTNVGHLESAAGIAGLIKAVLALERRELPANLHFHTLNPHIPWSQLPVHVASTSLALPANAPLLGVSSFGMGGTNVHVLLAPPPAAISPAPSATPPVADVFPLSAHTPAAVVALARAWADHLGAHPHLALRDVCHTAAVGRSHFACRVALVTDSVDRLRASLLALGEGDVTRVSSAAAPRVSTATTAEQLAADYRNGCTLDWRNWLAGSGRRLGGLPTYRFQRRRFWLEAARPETARADVPTFVVEWRALPRDTTTSPPPASWLIVGESAEVGSALSARHHRVTTVGADDFAKRFPAHDGHVILVRPTLDQVFAIARQIVERTQPAARLWIVTERAIGTGPETSALDLGAAPLAGFARAFALEHPGHWGGLFDGDGSAESNDAFVAELLTSGADDFVAWREHQRLVPRLVPHARPPGATPAFRSDRTYLITGGTGGLGLALSRWLVAHGVRHLALLARRAPAEALLTELRAAGAEVRFIAADLASPRDVERGFAELAAHQPPLAGVFHAAGVAGFTPLAALQPDEMARVLAPKIVGARLLDERTRGMALDHFVLFSSIASVWGSTGQTHYAAANAALDALAHERRRLGLPALSVNWGPWDDTGMAVAAREQLRRIGLTAIAPADALALLGRLLRDAPPQVVAARVEWTLLRPVLALRHAQPLLEAFAEKNAPPPPPTSAILTRLRAADRTQRAATLAPYLHATLARVLGRDPAEPIERTQGFFALGMDSLMAVELRALLETDLALELPGTIAFDRASLAAIEEELLALVFPADASATAPIVSAPAPRTASDEPIAITGLACRFPGGVSTPAEFWALLREGRDGVRPVPAGRWDVAAHYHPDPAHAGTMYVREFGFIDGVDQFDAAFFNLRAREAAATDPQQRLLLESAWEALESAGLANERLRGSATGVFVGVSTNDYAQLLLRAGDPTRIDAYFGTGNALNAIAGRLAYTLGLRGPALVTDTACSSSLVALHQACASLRAGECSAAIAAGVNLLLAPEPTIALSRARMLAPDGRCKTFAASADGYGRGEGCGVVVLRRLRDARAAGEPILAIIAGSAVNQDGATSGFTVPSGDAQRQLIATALARAGRTPDELDYVEAHGTGTPLGDPIELNALAAVAGRERARPLLVGSVKTNLGHLEAAAGIAGLIKTTLALHHRAIPAHLHFAQPNPHVAWTELPLRVPTQLTAWPEPASPRPRLAGVSAFGFSGTNAHVVLEAAPDSATPAPVDAGPQLIPLSARTPEALRAQRTRLLAWLEQNTDVALADIARTFGAGRLHHALREACVARSVAELKAQLKARLSAPAPVAPPPVSPLRWICPDFSALAAGESWLRRGLTPALVLGETPGGLLAAAVLAGIFTADEARRLAHDPRELATATPRAPRLGFGHCLLGRIDDTDAASPDWWRTALAGQLVAGPRTPPAMRELVLAPSGDLEQLQTAADLYVAGYALDWRAFAEQGRHAATAPTYPFQHQRHWLEPVAPAARSVAPRNGLAALLGERLALPGSTEVRFAADYAAATPAWLEHHRLFGRVIVPAAQHLALLFAAAPKAVRHAPALLSALTFPRALALADDERRAVQLVLAPAGADAFAVRLLSEPAAGETEWTQHLAATIAAEPARAEPAMPQLETAAAPVSGDDFYRVLATAGYTLGASFRWIATAQLAAGGALATLAAPAGTLEPDACPLHPGLIDSCFQLLGWAAGVQSAELAEGNAIYIPAGIDAVRYYRVPATRTLRCVAQLAPGDPARTHRLRGDLFLCDDTGALCLEVRGFEARRAPRALLTGDATTAATFHLAWPELPAATPSTASFRWSLLGHSPQALALGERLRTRGHAVDHANEPEADATGVVLFFDHDTGPTPADAVRLLTLVQTLAALSRRPRLWVVTRGAQAVPGDHDPISGGAAAAIGLGRIVAVEHPELRAVLVDLDPAAPAGEDAALEAELLATGDENQIALRGPRRLAARFVPAPPPAAGPAAARLALGAYGDLDSLALAPVARRTPGPGELELEVRAAGLNFRDVLGALGVLRPHLESLGIASAAELPLGGECAGLVTAVGAGVSHWRVGDAALAAFAPGSLATHVIADARFVTAKPDALTFAEAATLPVAYLTAHHALREVAALRAGERVLIHAAAGGVGLAAVFVARLLGAEVCATASPAKWPLLRQLGVTILGHSRTTDYAQEFAPVDVVLNSLTGDHIPRSLELLAPSGRFIEIGKLGIWSSEQVAAKRPDVTYHAFDLVTLSRAEPETLERHLRTLALDWSAARLPALPSRNFALADAAAAFRTMAQARHTGKLVLVRPPAAPSKPRRDGVYLVTGGLGALGLQVAAWLARGGAGTIVLAARGAPQPGHAATLAELRAGGTRVAWRAADFAQPGTAAALVADVVREFGPLRGVFHCAGALDDDLIPRQTPARLAAVFAPKAAAAWQLHEATRTQPVDFFVLFSSLAAVLGSTGQSSYAAANAALDALAHHRQRLGLPALSINWGPWAGGGMAARLGERERTRLAALGLTAFEPAAGLAALDALLRRTEPQLAAALLEPRTLLANFSTPPPLLRALAAPGDRSSTRQTARSELVELSPTARVARVMQILSRRLATELGLAAGEALPTDRTLISFGLDSLAAVELKTWIASEFTAELPLADLPGHTVEKLAHAILAALQLADATTGETTTLATDAVLRAAAVLPDEVRPRSAIASRGAPRAVLITGATGFLGAFLLHELLTTTQATLHCLVRARDASEARQRIAENLRAYGLPAELPADRIIPVCGDLAQPRLGLGEKEFTALAAQIDAILHNGAWLNFIYPYATLEATNVHGTREVLRLATLGAPKHVHYVSTSGVFYSRAYRGKALPETDAAGHCEGHALGYSQTKWVAEQLVAAAAARGLPVTIHRAPFITGATDTGAWNADDFICRLVRGVIALGAMPELAASMDLVPVDYVARAITRLINAPAQPGVQRHHLAARNVVPWSALADWLAAHGYPVQRVPYADWLTRLPPLRGTPHPLAPFLALFLEPAGPDRATVPEIFLQSAHARLDNTVTQQRLAALGLDTPALDGALWATYLGALARAGLIPPAPVATPP